jgi:hypothetical protein
MPIRQTADGKFWAAPYPVAARECQTVPSVNGASPGRSGAGDIWATIGGETIVAWENKSCYPAVVQRTVAVRNAIVGSRARQVRFGIRLDNASVWDLFTAEADADRHGSGMIELPDVTVDPSGTMEFTIETGVTHTFAGTAAGFTVTSGALQICLTAFPAPDQTTWSCFTEGC